MDEASTISQETVVAIAAALLIRYALRADSAAPLSLQWSVADENSPPFFWSDQAEEE